MFSFKEKVKNKELFSGGGGVAYYPFKSWSYYSKL